MVDITIDGNKVQAREGSSVLENIRNLRIDMPTLCYHQELAPFGACRLCTVEIRANGKGRLTTACDCPVKPGLEIVTASEQAQEARKFAVWVTKSVSCHEMWLSRYHGNTGEGTEMSKRLL